MKSKYSFGFAAGVVKVRETRLIPAARWRALAEMNPDDFLSALKETDYGRFVSAAGGFDELAALQDHWRAVRGWPGVAGISDFIFLKHDYLNAKVFCRARLAGFEAPLNFSDFCLEPNCLEIEHLKRIVFEGKKEKTSGFLAAALAEILADQTLENDPVRVDYILDQSYLNQIKKISAGRPGHFFPALAAVWIDIYNLGAFFRIQAYHRPKTYFEKYFVSGGRFEKSNFMKLLNADWAAVATAFKNSGLARLADALSQFLKSGNPDSYERELRSLETTVINRSRFLPAGPEAVLAFALKREQEIKNIKIMEIAKNSGLEATRIMALMENADA